MSKKLASWKLHRMEWVGSLAGSKHGVEGPYGEKAICSRSEVERERSGDATVCESYVG